MTDHEDCDCPLCGPEDEANDWLQKMHENSKVRFAQFNVAGRPPWSYTSGFYKLGVPEIIVYSFPIVTANNFFEDLYRRVEAKTLDLKDWTITDDLSVLQEGDRSKKLPIAFREVDPRLLDGELDRAVQHAEWDHRPWATPLQMVWSDRAGLLPWEKGFDDSFRKKQPELWHRARN
jgi:hypothetical protein